MKYFASSLVLLLLAATLAPQVLAFEEVRVFQPRSILEEGAETPTELSPSELRVRTLQLGFSEGVMQTALGLLPEAPSEERLAALKSFFEGRAGDWVLGYKEVASSATEEGLNMVLQVDVNRRAVRDVVEQLGLTRPFGQALSVSVRRGASLLEADQEAIASVLALVNAREVPGADPSISLDRMESGTLRGELMSERGSWTAMDADVESVWFALWEKYNSMSVSRANVGVELLVSGWFTPDGVNDFDRALQGWEELIRTARMTEMDLATEGVSARWIIQPMDMTRLQARLKEYLPPRGLEYTLRTSQ